MKTSDSGTRRTGRLLVRRQVFQIWHPGASTQVRSEEGNLKATLFQRPVERSIDGVYPLNPLPQCQLFLADLEKALGIRL